MGEGGGQGLGFFRQGRRRWRTNYHQQLWHHRQSLSPIRPVPIAARRAGKRSRRRRSSLPIRPSRKLIRAGRSPPSSFHRCGPPSATSENFQTSRLPRPSRNLSIRQSRKGCRARAIRRFKRLFTPMSRPRRRGVPHRLVRASRRVHGDRVMRPMHNDKVMRLRHDGRVMRPMGRSGGMQIF